MSDNEISDESLPDGSCLHARWLESDEPIRVCHGCGLVEYPMLITVHGQRLQYFEVWSSPETLVNWEFRSLADESTEMALHRIEELTKDISKAVTQNTPKEELSLAAQVHVNLALLGLNHAK